MSSPSAKRHRQDGPGSDAWYRHPTLWLEDGDIILVCDDMGFCVARSILSLNSPKFKDMLKIVRHSKKESHESLPVVHLSDTVDEMECLLMAIHFRQYGQIKSQPSYFSLARILKMSTKYMVDDLREEILGILVITFPSCLDKDYGKRYVPEDFNTTDRLRVVQLAQETNVPLILPHASYLTCSLPLEEVVNFSSDPGCYPPLEDVVNSSDSVSNETRWTCVLFRTKFAKAVSEILEECNSSADSPWKLCAPNGRWICGEDNCVGVRNVVKEEMENTFRFPERRGDDIFHLTQPNGRDLCAACNERMDKHWRRVKGKIWASLPSLCGFKDWEAVSDAQKVASRREQATAFYVAAR